MIMKLLTLAGATLIALPAFAQGEAPAADAIPWWYDVLPVVGTAAIAALGWLLKLLTNWLATKVKSEYWSGVITRADDLALRIVNDTYQNTVQKMKEAKADGKLSQAEKDQVKGAALKSLKDLLGTKGLREIAKLLGADSSVEGFLSTTVEHAVATAKNVGAASKGPRKNP